MKILYVSVHAVLEDDEIRLFKNLGHNVFSLGINFGLKAIEPFRESITFNETERSLLDEFFRMGCSFRYGAQYSAETVIAADFVKLFDVVVVMHDLEFIQRFWTELSLRPVIWRTIGQNIDGSEALAGTLRAQGMHVVRYSPVERHAIGYCGESALIRFCKDPATFGPWNGHALHVLSFCNTLAQRYPALAASYRDIVRDLPSMLGGIGNEGLPGHIGMLSPAQQAQHYEACRAYLYCSGADIPYTLNFIEALMTGMPIVALSSAPTERFYEVPALLGDGAGIVAETVDDARHALRTLLDDADLARSISQRARTRATDLFSSDRIGPQWETLFRIVA